MEQQLYIVTGLPFSGKSTFIRNLSKRFDFEITSVDEMIEKGGFKSTVNMKQEDWNLVYRQAYDKLKELLGFGKSVVFDGGSLLRSERDTLKEIADSCHVAWKLIYINTPREEIIGRRKKTIETNDRDPLEEETIQKALDMFEEPTPEEQAIELTPNNNFDEWVKKNIEK